MEQGKDKEVRGTVQLGEDSEAGNGSLQKKYDINLFMIMTPKINYLHLSGGDNIKRIHKNLAGVEIILLAILFITLRYYGSTDDFSFKHLGQILWIATHGRMLTSYMTIQFPGYYIFGAIFYEVLDLNLPYLTYTPVFLIMLVPFTALLLKLLKLSRPQTLSNAYLIGAWMAVIAYIIIQKNMSSFTIWVGGVTGVVFYTLLLLFLAHRTYENTKLSFIVALTMLSIGISTLYYDYEARTLLLAGTLSVMYILLGKREYKMFLYSAGIVLAIEFGLKKFVYKTCVPSYYSVLYLKRTGQFIPAMSKLVSMIHPSRSTGGSISKLIVHLPRSLTYIYIVQYMIIILAILLFMFTIIRVRRLNLLKRQAIIFVLALIVSVGIWIILRIQIGGIPVTDLFLPALMSLIVLYTLNAPTRIVRYLNIFAMAGLTIMVLTSIASQALYPVSTVTIDRSIGVEYAAPAGFYSEYLIEYTRISDVYTNGILSAFEVYYTNVNKYTSLLSKAKVIPKSDLVFIAYHGSVTMYPNSVLISNYKLRSMSLENWVIVYPWSYYKPQLRSMKTCQLIYTTRWMDMCKFNTHRR